MSQTEDQKLVTIVEEREEEMVAHTGGIPTLRLARFLKPSITSIHEPPHAQAQPQAQSPPLSKTQAYNFTKSPLTVHFSGWRSPQKNWKKWVGDLKPRYGEVWKKTGIYDSIMTSTYEFRKDEDLILGLAEFWCPDTNTFVFSWGETTITLEDMLIIGGFPITGELVTSPLTGELVEIEEKMIKEYRMIMRSKAHKVQHSGWIKRFMGLNGDSEHVAFLALWISRYVFPSKTEDKVSKHAFPVAVRLSQETRVALAPAILASLYRDLGVLKGQIDYSSTTDSNNLAVTVCAPFQVMKLWAWERFPSLQPNPKYLIPGEPRAARWHCHTSKSELKLVRSTLNSVDGFLWRPYSCVLDNWRHPLYSKEQGDWVVITPNANEELLLFIRCFLPCELVGLDCKAQYHPHRVGMQFGLDQHIPDPFTHIKENSEIVWRTYENIIREMICYIPPLLFESDVTVQYFEWWNQSSSIKDSRHNISSVHETSSSSLGLSSKSSESETSLSPAPTIAGQRLVADQTPSDEYEMPISEWYKHRRDSVPDSDRTANSRKYLASSLVVCPSSTANEKAPIKEHLTKSSEEDLYNKGLTRSENSSRVDKCVRSNVCSEPYYHAATNTDEDSFPGLELEERIDKLEAIVKSVKMERRRVFSGTKMRA